MPTQVGDVLPGPDGPREVVWVMDADAYIAEQRERNPTATHRGSSSERCALYGNTKGTTPQEKHG